MTTFCGGGPSAPIPGLAETIFVGPAAIGSLLNNIPTKWALPFAAYLGAKTYDLSVFCLTDPPADPGLTAADFIAMLDFFNPLVNGPAYAKFQQYVDRWFWFQFCYCPGIAPPALPTPPTEPVGMPAVNPPVNSPLPTAPCWDKKILANVLVGFDNGVSPDICPTNNTPMSWSPNNATVNFTVNNDVAGASSIQMNLAWFTAGGSFIGNVRSATTAPGGSGTVSLARPSNGAIFFVDILWVSGTGSNTVSLELIMDCGNGAPTGYQTPCCPPDPVLAGTLQQLLGLVTLIQRQQVPFGYIAGTAHAGLINQGTIAVQGLIGAKVALTVLPGSYGRQLAEPTYLYDVGWWSVGTADGFVADRRIQSSAQLWFPDDMGAMTVIGYSLSPGVVATITELEREV